MKPQVGNIYEGAKSTDAEDFRELFKNASVRIERIVSRTHSSPPGFWYDQDENEWVVVLKGNAVLEFERGESVAMREGDYVAIPRHLKHRVMETKRETWWLAVHSQAKNS